MPRCGPGCTAGQPGFIALHAGEVPVFTTCNTLKADRDGSRVGIEAVVAGLPGLIAALVACDGGDGGDAGGFAVVDSAGVRIATSASPQWPEGGGWSLAEAILDIGAAGNDPDHELFRVLGAVRLPGGGVVVANSGSGELRFFAADGTLVRRVGRKGEGPGEFTRIEDSDRSAAIRRSPGTGASPGSAFSRPTASSAASSHPNARGSIRACFGRSTTEASSSRTDRSGAR